jgi:hypothetical protein
MLQHQKIKNWCAHANADHIPPSRVSNQTIKKVVARHAEELFFLFKAAMMTRWGKRDDNGF